MERPKSQGRSVTKKALAAPAPGAAANPSGRQQLIVAMELSIASSEADTPVLCFRACPPPCFQHRSVNYFRRGKPTCFDPGYRRQLSPKFCAFCESTATSRPLIRTVGESQDLSSRAISSSLTIISRTSAVTPCAARASLTSLTAAV